MALARTPSPSIKEQLGLWMGISKARLVSDAIETYEPIQVNYSDPSDQIFHEPGLWSLLNQDTPAEDPVRSGQRLLVGAA